MEVILYERTDKIILDYHRKSKIGFNSEEVIELLNILKIPLEKYELKMDNKPGKIITPYGFRSIINELL